jgi:hypothetical protein
VNAVDAWLTILIDAARVPEAGAQSSRHGRQSGALAAMEVVMRPGPQFVLVLVLSFALLSGTAHAQAYVPTNYPTISAALASGAPDIRVLAGTYVENLTINRPVHIRGIGGPTVQGNVIAIALNPHGNARFEALHFVGNIVVQTTGFSDRIELEGCRIEGRISQGLSTAETGVFSITDCVVDDGIDLNPSLAFYVSNTILGGLKTGFEDDLIITGNHIQGPAAVGIDVKSMFSTANIINNIVTETTIGIRKSGAGSSAILSNIIRYCTDDGVEVGNGGEGHATGYVELNFISDCGGDGIDLLGLITCRANQVVRSGQVGIRADGTNAIQANRVLFSGQQGLLSVGSSGIVDTNIVARSGLGGIEINGGMFEVRNNTIYLNHGNGLSVAGSGFGSQISNNISFVNDLKGLSWSAANPPTLSCNDWFANFTGNVSGTPPGATDFAVDPLFCNMPLDFVDLAVSSPLVGTPCGLIGADPNQCTVAVSVPGPIVENAFHASPVPARGSVTFSRRTPTGFGYVEVFDARGARQWRADLNPGQSQVVWNGIDSRGEHARAGIYFARLTEPGQISKTRIVLTP